jgi:hypothetical protein
MNDEPPDGDGERPDGAGPSRTAAADASTRSIEAWETIRKLDLVENIAELEATGLTVVEPEKVADPGFAARLRGDRAVGEQRSCAARSTRRRGPGRERLRRVFGLQLCCSSKTGSSQEAIMNPVALALSTYCCR